MNDKKIELDPWDSRFVEPNLPAAELQRWHAVRDRLKSTGRLRKLSKSDVSKKSGIPTATLYAWFDGSYNGDIAAQTERVETFLKSIDELSATAALIPVAPGYVDTPTSIGLTNMLMYAQMMPSMVIGVLGSGMGKTMTGRQYAKAHAGVIHVTMRPTTKSIQRMLAVIADELEITDRSTSGHERSIGKKLRRNGRNTLLIIDEAQNLIDEAVNQLRYFLDEYGVGIALLGNLELYSRFGDKEPKPAFAQLHRRIGMRMRQLEPAPGDLDAIMVAWKIEDPEVIKICRAISRKPGALGQVSETLKLAGMLAAGDQRPLAAPDLLTALKNRGVEAL